MLKCRRLLQAHLGVETYPDKEHAQQKRYTPAPGRELLRGEYRREYQEDRVGDDDGNRHALLGEAAIETTLFPGSILGSDEHGPAPLSADGETLYEAEDDEYYRRRDAYGCVGRHNTHEGRGYPHHEQRGDQRFLPPDPIPEVPEHHSPEGSGQKAYGERGEGRQRSYERRGLRKEELPEHQGRSRPVDKKVIPFDSGARKTDQSHP